jgi:hypothetical protein
MTPGFDALGYWLADYYALATCVLIGVGLSMAALKQPARRLAVCWSGLAGLCALVVFGAIPSWPRLSLITASSPAEEMARAPAPRFDPVRAPAGSQATAGDELGTERVEAISTKNAAVRRTVEAIPRVRSEDPAAPAWPVLDWPWLAGCLFLTGDLFVMAWLALGSWQTACLRRRSKRAPEAATAVLAQVDGAGHPAPDLRVSTDLLQPVALGVLRPAIILPEHFVENEPENRLEAALRHEWAHIRNGDLWLIALLRLLLLVLYAHPLYWWLRRRIRDDQEALADASAAVGEGQVSYAEVLLSWSSLSWGRPPQAPGGAHPQ